MPPSLVSSGADVWIAEEGGTIAGSGTFIRSEDHVGVYCRARRGSSSDVAGWAGSLAKEAPRAKVFGSPSRPVFRKGQDAKWAFAAFRRMVVQRGTSATRREGWMR